MNNHSITLHSPSDFESMKKAGQLASDVLDYLTPFVEPKVTTGFLFRLWQKNWPMKEILTLTS